MPPSFLPSTRTIATALLAVCVPGLWLARASGNATGERTARTAGGAGSPGRGLEGETDRARAAFVAGDTPRAAASLRRTAWLLTAVTRPEDVGLAGPALAASAGELAALAAAVESGAVRRVRTLDDVVARARLADARKHYARVMPLVRNLHNAEAGIELLWAVDHLGRVMRDAAPGAGTDTAAVLSDARAAALRLTRPDGGVPVGTGVVLERLGDEIARATARTMQDGTGTTAPHAHPQEAFHANATSTPNLAPPGTGRVGGRARPARGRTA